MKAWKWIRETAAPQPRLLATYQLVDGAGRHRATIWQNSGSEFTWHTWNTNGVGGENAGAYKLNDAKDHAIAALVRQGWAPGGWRVEWETTA